MKSIDSRKLHEDQLDAHLAELEKLESKDLAFVESVQELRAQLAKKQK